MNRIDIQERLEAIVEDIFDKAYPFSLRDSIESFFYPDDLPVFFEMVAEEFDVDTSWMEESTPSSFFALIEWIAEEIN